MTFTLQTFAKDVAGNVTLTPPDTLVFDDDFENPEPHMFKVERPKGDDDKALPDSSIVGQDLSLIVTAWDTVLDQAAVTYDEDDVLVSFWCLLRIRRWRMLSPNSGVFTVSEGKDQKYGERRRDREPGRRRVGAWVTHDRGDHRHGCLHGYRYC